VPNIGAFIDFSMPPKPQSKELEDILNAIQNRLTAIQTQMETQEQCQSALETKNESLHSSLSFLIDQVSSLPPPNPTTIPSPFHSSSMHSIHNYQQPHIGTTSTSIPFIPDSFNSHLHTATTMTTQPITNQPPPPFIRPPKLQLAFFEGPDPLDWLFQADQYFTFYQITPEKRLSMVAFHMKGEALSWFKWMHHNNLLTDWHSFTRALELRFGPSSYTNHQAELFKLQQHGSVSEYQTHFEKLSNCVIGLSSDTILNCFISGLQPEIRRELTILHPYSISQAIRLAKLIEDKIKDSKPKYPRPQPHNPTHIHPQQNPNNRIPQHQPTTPHLPIKRLTPAQLQERRTQGLCYNCDEKFTPGHKCSTARFLLLMDHPESPIDPPIDPPPTNPNIPEVEDTIHYLSPQAFSGNPSPKTLKFTGLIHNLPVIVLVDSGSSHNILQPRIAHHLHLPIKPTPPFSVIVGDGALISQYLYLGFPIHYIPFQTFEVQDNSKIFKIKKIKE